MTKNELNEIIRLHQKWLNNEKDGKRANLYGANLRSADLRSANLYGANLRSADLRSANLYGANLRSANLRSADLRSADLRSANLYGADLRSANLYGANLRIADLRSADLRSANLYGADLRSADLRSANLHSTDLRSANLPGYSIVPDEGPFYGYKKVVGDVILTLYIPRTSKRVNAVSSRKCRAEKVKVVKAESKDGKEIGLGPFVDKHSGKTSYKVGNWVKPDSFNEDIREECTNGIHFFITKKEAKEY